MAVHIFYGLLAFSLSRENRDDDSAEGTIKGFGIVLEGILTIGLFLSISALCIEVRIARLTTPRVEDSQIIMSAEEN